VVQNALKGLPLPVYGDGQNVRDWLYVTDHCDGIRAVLERGVAGQTYNIGGRQEMSNLEVVRQICTTLDELKPAGKPYARPDYLRQRSAGSRPPLCHGYRED